MFASAYYLSPSLLIHSWVSRVIIFSLLTNTLSDHSFLSRINLNNPLSISKGQMAIAFARLALRLLSETRPVFPLDMKRLVAKHWALYDPYQQHDTQEFLNFLLDCIHEDLNMASRTPFTIVDEDRSDEELAQTYWQAHVLRNDSLVVDSFFGMYKSQIMCTSCSKVSTKFDPFMSLTLEIPEQPVYHDFIVVRADLSKVEVRIPITVKDTVNDVLIDLALQLKAEGPVSIKWCYLRKSSLTSSRKLKLVATSFESSRIREVIDKATPHQDLYDRLKSTVVYETRPGIAYVVVNHSVHGETGLVPFGIPFIVSLPTGSPISIDDMKMKILQLLKLARIVKHDPDVEAYVGAELRPTVLENGPTYTMDLIWDSIETKNALYDEEEDFKVFIITHVSALKLTKSL